MKTSLAVIAASTFRDTMRNRALYWVLSFCAGLVCLSVSFGEWSVFSRSQVMADFGLAILSVAGLLLALFVGVGLLGRELSEKTVYLTVVRPIGRGDMLLGKYAGLMTALVVSYAALYLVFWLILRALSPTLPGGLWPAALLTLVELAVVVAVSLLLSVITTQALASVLTLAFYVAGHFNDLVDLQLVQSRSSIFAAVLKTVYYLFPNLEHFNVRSLVVYGAGVGWDYTAWATLYGMFYVVFFLCIAWLVLDRRDL